MSSFNAKESAASNINKSYSSKFVHINMVYGRAATNFNLIQFEYYYVVQ